MLRRLSLILLVLFLSIPLAAQSEPPLVGPVIALNTPEQDRIILYDLGARDPDDAQRELNFGTRWHYVWGFSPDGCRLLYTLSEGTQPARLYSAHLDGSDPRELVVYDELPAEDWGIWEPQWSPVGSPVGSPIGSPDGELIAFTMIRDRPGSNGEIEREYHVARIPATGGEPEFYSVTGREHSPQWSPDGTWLAYTSYEERPAGADAFSTAVPTSEPPPGQTPVPAVMLDEADLWVVSADGETKYWLTQFATGSVREPRWSPDGELISFIYSPSSYNDTFWMIANQKDAIPTTLNYEWVLVLDTTWLPDSTGILASVRGLRGIEENRLWLIPLLGNADETATLYPDDTISPSLMNADFARFSADGNWLALRSAYDLVLINRENNTWAVLEGLMGNTIPVWSPAGFVGEQACSN